MKQMSDSGLILRLGSAPGCRGLGEWVLIVHGSIMRDQILSFGDGGWLCGRMGLLVG